MAHYITDKLLCELKFEGIYSAVTYGGNEVIVSATKLRRERAFELMVERFESLAEVLRNKRELNGYELGLCECSVIEQITEL